LITAGQATSTADESLRAETGAEAGADTDGGPRDRKAGPARLCIAMRTVRPVEEMIRFVVDPDGAIVPDIKRKLPGRGVWVTATAVAVSKAAAKNAFARSLRQPVRVPADLAGVTEALLEQSALDALSIANKAGLVKFGFARVETALVERRAVALLHAAEAGADGVRKLAAARRRGGGDREPIFITAFTAMQLDLALGRPNVIHAALLAGAASEAFIARYRGLAAFRGSAAASEIAIPCE
jgi:predicted RNA-binding protein YlxR (DUF448 family)